MCTLELTAPMRGGILLLPILRGERLSKIGNALRLVARLGNTARALLPAREEEYAQS